MPRVAVQLLFAVLLTLVGSLEAAAAKRIALVIGNNAYSNLPVLLKAANDARSVAATLKQIGFKVHHGEDLTRRQTSRKLADFTADLSPGDQAFLFFAGHGVAIGAENYLIPTDMPKPRLGEEGLVRDEAIAVSALVSRVQRRGAAASFFVLDACRDNPFAATGVRSIGSSRGLARVNAPSGVFVLFSAGIGQTALDRLSDADPDENSVFTRKLLPLLNTPGLTHVGLAKTLQREVSALAGTVPHRQQPAYYDQIIGEIVLRPAKAVQPSPVTKTEPSPPMSPAAEAWNFVKETNTASDLEAYIERFPESFFADLARTRLIKLRQKSKPSEAGTVAGRNASKRNGEKPRIVAEHKPGLDEADPAHVPQKSGSSLAVVEPPHECDRLAASPFDRDRVSPGIFESDFNQLEDAVKHCREALLIAPRNARFRFQLSRALMSPLLESSEGPFVLREAAEAGSTAAMVRLGQAHFRGHFVEKNHKRAVELLEKASALGDGYAMALLAVAHAEGIGVAVDESLALSWANKAVQSPIARQLRPRQLLNVWVSEMSQEQRRRHAKLSETVFEQFVSRFGLERGGAEFVIAMAYPGLSSSVDHEKRWLTRAFRAGNSLAAFIMTVELLDSGQGESAGRLALLLRDAADAGDDFSKFVIGAIFTHGLGVEKNPKQALRWIGQALKSGFHERVLEAVAEISKAQAASVGFSSAEAAAATDIVLGFLSDFGKRPGDAELVYGLILGPDTEDGLTSIRNAAAQGNETAHLTLAVRSLELLIGSGFAFGSDESAASEHGYVLRAHTKAAAEQGNILGMAGMAFLAANGIGGPSDELLARKWINKIVEGGIVDRLLPLVEVSIAQAVMEGLYSKSDPISVRASQDSTAVASVARDVIAHIFGAKSRHAGRRLIGLGRIAAEVSPDEVLETAAAAQDPLAMLILGMNSAYGPNPTTDEGVAKNKRAATWIRKSAEQGEPFGQLAFALAHALGVGVERDTNKAVHWMDEALKGRFGAYLPKLAPAAAEMFAQNGPTAEMKSLMSRLSKGLAEPKGQAELFIAMAVTLMEAEDQTLKWLIRAAADGNVTARKTLEDDSLIAALR